MVTAVVQLEVIGEARIGCKGCESLIANVLGRLQGVEKVEASAQAQRVAVTIDPAKVTEEDVRASMQRIGYRTAGTKSG